jgi:hypothetical protein
MKVLKHACGNNLVWYQKIKIKISKYKLQATWLPFLPNILFLQLSFREFSRREVGVARKVAS